MNKQISFDKQRFTEHVMDRIAIEAALRSRRREVWNGIAYGICGLLGLTVVLGTLHLTGIISFDYFLSLLDINVFENLTNFIMTSQLLADLAAIFRDMGTTILAFVSLIVSNTIVFVPLVSMVVLICISRPFFQRLHKS